MPTVCVCYTDSALFKKRVHCESLCKNGYSERFHTAATGE